jgi:hypothetical protein
MLRNPVYCGVLVAGRWSQGKFSRIDADGLIWHDNAHDPIVSRRLFDAVQDELRRRFGLHREYRRADAGQYLLGQRVRCDHCGGKLYGHTATSDGRRHYGSQRRHHAADCPRLWVTPTCWSRQSLRFCATTC